jgi:hypothetical protein
MSRSPKETDLIALLNEQERMLKELQFIISSQTFSLTGNGSTGATGAQGIQGIQGIQGNTGNTGSAGAAATISVGTVSTGSIGSSATVTNAGTSSAAVFNFSIPVGATGAQGIQGDTGPQGASGNDLIGARVIFLS